MLKAYVIALTTLIAAIVGGSAAFAHSELQSTVTGAGKSPASPIEIRFRFNESILPQFSGIELKDQIGNAIATGKAAKDPTNRKVLIVPLKVQLSPGDYTVEWHAVSDDTHKVKGSYSFGVVR